MTTAINRLKNEFIENKFSDEQHQELKEQMQRCEYDIRNCITGIFSHVYERDAFVYRLSDRNQVLDKMRKNIDFRLMGRRHIAELEKDLPYKTEIDSSTNTKESTLSSTAINQPISNTESTLSSTAINQPISNTESTQSTTQSQQPVLQTVQPVQLQQSYERELSGDEILANYYETAIYEEENEPLIFEELYD